MERNKDSSWPLPIRSLGVSFFYDSEKDSDFVRLEDGKELALRHSSSGLMSVTPLLLVFDYVMKTVYRKERIPSPEEYLFLNGHWKNGTDTTLSDRTVVSRNISKLKKLQSNQEDDWELRRLLKVSTDYAYYTAAGDEAHNFIVVVEDNFGNSFELEFELNNRNAEGESQAVMYAANFKPMPR